MIPLSTRKLNDGIEFHVDLSGYDHTALVEQMRVISKKRLDKPLRKGGKIPTVDPEDMKKIYEQINKYFATTPKKRKTEKKQ